MHLMSMGTQEQAVSEDLAVALVRYPQNRCAPYCRRAAAIASAKIRARAADREHAIFSREVLRIVRTRELVVAHQNQTDHWEHRLRAGF